MAAGSLEQEVIRGQEAKQLLNNRIYKEALQGVKDGIVNSMAQSALGDESTHHRLVIALQLLNQLERAISSVAETGEMAALEIETKKKFLGIPLP